MRSRSTRARSPFSGRVRRSQARRLPRARVHLRSYPLMADLWCVARWMVRRWVETEAGRGTMSHTRSDQDDVIIRYDRTVARVASVHCTTRGRRRLDLGLRRWDRGQCLGGLVDPSTHVRRLRQQYEHDGHPRDGVAWVWNGSWVRWAEHRRMVAAAIPPYYRPG